MSFVEPTSGVDPVSASLIMKYLTALPERQGMIFSSHRLDECVQLCDRALMMYDAQLQFDGAMHTLSELCGMFFQVDIHLVPVSDAVYSAVTPMDNFLSILIDSIGPGSPIERVVVYSAELIRITFGKNRVRFSTIWRALQKLANDQQILQYTFRCIDIEDIFSIIISNSKAIQNSVL